jgi:hypothetical protein
MADIDKYKSLLINWMLNIIITDSNSFIECSKNRHRYCISTTKIIRMAFKRDIHLLLVSIRAKQVSNDILIRVIL